MLSLRLLRPGNDKLGPGLYCWSILAGDTCPGATEACLSVCYAMNHHFRGKTVVTAHRRNWELSKSPKFIDDMLHEIRYVRPEVLRVHVAGDFYDARYTDKWAVIARKTPRTTFLAYTRSWQDVKILPSLKKLAKLDNVALWFSCDSDMRAPPKVPGVHRAYMQQNDGEEPPYDVDLVFRVKRKTVSKRVKGVVVCPPENGVETQCKITCTRCRICFSGNIPAPRQAFDIHT